ncbi:hypothetical protein TWF281_007864 [Arthrobotrys megalospora]
MPRRLIITASNFASVEGKFNHPENSTLWYGVVTKASDQLSIAYLIDKYNELGSADEVTAWAVKHAPPGSYTEIEARESVEYEWRISDSGRTVTMETTIVALGQP